MLISSNTANLLLDVQKAEKYCPYFALAGITALDYNFDDLFCSTDIHKHKRSEIFDLPENELKEYFLQIKSAADKNGLVFGQTHAPFPSQLIDCPKEYNDYLLEVIKKSIEITSLFDCKYIVIHPVFGRYDNPLSKEQEHKINIDFYSSLIPTLKKCGVTACLENMWVSNKGKIYGAVCSDFYEVNQYIKELNDIAGDELFGFCYDCGHATLVGADHERAIKLLGNNIKVVHLHDVDGVHDSHTFPFLGVTDWKRVMSSLASIGYKGTLNFEAYQGWCCYPESVYASALAVLGQIGKNFAEEYFN